MIKYLNKKIKIIIRKAIYLLLFLSDTYIIKRSPGIFVFCYHGFANDSWRYSITIHMFTRQMMYLLKHGYTPITLKDIEMYIDGKIELKKKSFVVTIDDGYKDVLDLQTFFKKHHIVPTIFILSNRTQANRGELETNRELLRKNEILRLKRDGWIIGAHSATHPDFNTMSRENIIEEVINSKHILEKKLGIDIKYFAYPKGRYTTEVIETVKKAGYRLGLSMNSGFVDRTTNPLLIPRIGVDRTHNFFEFISLFQPSSVAFRNFVVTKIGAII